LVSPITPGAGGAGGAGGVVFPCGVILENSNNSLSYLNSIYSSNNVDNGTNNQWDNGIIGNYWSNYNGSDGDPIDGRGDTYHYLNGSAGSYDTKPFVCSLYSDFDGDGLDNREEFILGVDGYTTNVYNYDSDYDGLSDYWEWKNGTNPLMKDTDGDSFIDGVEVHMGTDPNDPASYPGCELFVNIIEELFTEDEFKITLNILDWKNQGILGANITIWWNEYQVQGSDIKEMGNGDYNITLNPIFVSPGDDPILLKMTISATGYSEKYYEWDVAVPKSEETSVPEGISFEIYILTIMVLSGIILVLFAIILYFFLAARKRDDSRD